MKDQAYQEALNRIERAAKNKVTELRLFGLGRTELPPEIGQLHALRKLDLSDNQLSNLPPEIGQLQSLIKLDIRNNQLSSLPPEIGQLQSLIKLDIRNNQLSSLPPEIGQLQDLQELSLHDNQLPSLLPEIGQLQTLIFLDLSYNQLSSLPPEIGQLQDLYELHLYKNQLSSLPPEIRQLQKLRILWLDNNKFKTIPPEVWKLKDLKTLSLTKLKLDKFPLEILELKKLEYLWLENDKLTSLPKEIGQIQTLQALNLSDNQLSILPSEIRQLQELRTLYIQSNQLSFLPPEIGQLQDLRILRLENNQLSSLPASLSQLEKLEKINLDNNPLNPALESAYNAGLDELLAYLRSQEDAQPLYEAKLVLVGEGKVGKTTLLNALSGKEPREGEPTTHGVAIDIESLHLAHPEKEEVNIQLNAWDFGGQEVYRVTHQFFFSKRSIYLLVWEPRQGVQQCQVEDWLRMIRLRVGDDARVIIISTHCKTGQRIARIDKPVFLRDFGSMIVGFHEVDSLVEDPNTGEMVGIADLKKMIANTAKDLEHMEMPFSSHWKEARDELLAMDVPRIHYKKFADVCKRHNMDDTDARTLAGLMHDLGYIVYYGDDEFLKNDVVLKPEWLTKAIGFMLEDRTTQEMDGILPDSRLKEVWWDRPADKKTQFEESLYPFFLRLSEKYNVLYRLEDGKASLVAQHVPQVRPALPWLPEGESSPDRRRLAMICVIDEVPPGLVPWMIVRNHDFSFKQRNTDGKIHRLHWQKGMFLLNKSHGEAMLELRGREFHIYTEAVWPVFFMNILRDILQKLILDNWPGLKDRYYFAVPCPTKINGKMCNGRFDIEALQDFLDKGNKTFPCQACRSWHNIVELLYGFEKQSLKEQLQRIEQKIDGLDSRIANYVMVIMRAMATESKQGPRLFTVEPADGNWKNFAAKKHRLRLWCEAKECQHPVLEEGKGVYEFKVSREWLKRVAPYANFVAGVLKTMLPMVAPAANAFFGSQTIDELGIKDHLDLMKEATGTLLQGDLEIHSTSLPDDGVLSEPERSGILALHSFLRDLDPNHEKLGLKRMPTYTGEYIWLCPKHYEESQSKIPDKIG